MILNTYERMIVKRYLLPGRSEAIILLIASLSIGAVAVGVAALFIVTSIVNGFRTELFDKIADLNGHAVVQGYNGQLPAWRSIIRGALETPGVTSAKPLIEQPLLAACHRRIEGALVRGMRTSDILANRSIAEGVRSGSLRDLRPGSNTIAMGGRLAETLRARVGDEVQLVNPDGQTTPFGTVPRIMTYKVVAIFEVGIYDYDKAFIIMPLRDAQDLLLLGDAVGMVELTTVDPDRLDQIRVPLSSLVADKGVVIDWRDMNGDIFNVVRVSKVVIFVVMSSIVLVAVFSIFSLLMMAVETKRTDIAILRTMGASRISILKIFVSVGCALGGAGTFFGFAMGLVILMFRETLLGILGALTGATLWDPSIRFLDHLPAKADPGDIVVISMVAMVLSFLATIYPAYKAAATDPVLVLRYD